MAKGYGQKRKGKGRKGRASRKIPKNLRGYAQLSGAYGRFTGHDAELKFIDVPASAVSVTSTAAIQAAGSLCLMIQDATSSGRIGRQIRVKSLQFRGRIATIPSTTVAPSCNFFLYVLLDTQCNGLITTPTTVFTGANLSTALVELANSQRFKILKKVVVPLNPSAGVSTAYAPVQRPINFYLKMDTPIDYNGATAALTEIRSNSLTYIYGTDNASFNCQLDGTFRLRYSDM